MEVINCIMFSGGHKLELSDRKGIPTRLWSSESIFHRTLSSICQSADEFSEEWTVAIFIDKILTIRHFFILPFVKKLRLITKYMKIPSSYFAKTYSSNYFRQNLVRYLKIFDN